MPVRDPLEDGAGSSFSRPPSQWAGAAPLGGNVYWIFDPGLGPDGVLESILMWHWCTRQPPNPGDVEGGRWAAARVGKHTLVSIEPLHLEPSVLWNCCGKHGWVQCGSWLDA